MDRLGRSHLVRLVSFNQVQSVLSQICDYRPLSVLMHYSVELHGQVFISHFFARAIFSRIKFARTKLKGEGEPGAQVL